MKQQPSKRVVGLFLLMGAIAFFLLIGQSVWDKYSSSRKDQFVMYFEETLQGLSVGAPVVFQGVEIGKVARIEISTNEEDFSFKVPVFVTLKPLFISGKNIAWSDTTRDKVTLIRQMIDQGLRARLVVQSYLTGQLMIELVMLPGDKEEYRGNSIKYIEIPTVLSKGGELEKSIDNLNIQELVNKFSSVWNRIEEELPVLLPKITSCSTNLNRLLQKLSAKSDETVNNLNKTMQNVSDASRSIQNLTDYLERHPESLLAGKK